MIYITPCLFAAQPAIEVAMSALQKDDESLSRCRIGVKDCTSQLQDNLARRMAPDITVRASAGQP